MTPVLHADRPVTLIGGGPVSAADLRDALALAPLAVAADGGADAALRHGIPLEAVIGDMDSLSPAATDAFRDRLHPVAEQDSTDFDKALSRIDAPAILALGFSGGRLDHELAALHSLVARPHLPCLLIGPETLTLHIPPMLELPLAPGTLVSLFPFAAIEVRSKGLRWPTAGLRLDPLTQIGTSNEATGPVVLAPAGPGLLLILPRAALALALAALLDAARWPA